MVGELHVELVGGPHDGRELIVPAVCDCGSEVAPGCVLQWRGIAYVVGSNRCYAFFVPEAQAA